jgi:hypothetical protein
MLVRLDETDARWEEEPFDFSGASLRTSAEAESFRDWAQTWDHHHEEEN